MGWDALDDPNLNSFGELSMVVFEMSGDTIVSAAHFYGPAVSSKSGPQGSDGMSLVN